MLVAADHPARAATGESAKKPWRWLTVRDLLHRLAIAVENPGVDGVLAPPTSSMIWLS